MNIFSSLLLFVILACFSFVLQDDPYQPMKEIQTFKTKLNQTNQSISSMKCNFVQEKQLSFLAQKVISKGNLSYKKPDKMKIEYTTPFVYSMSLYNGKAYVKDNDKVSKFDTRSNKLFKYINDLMIQSVQGNILDNPDFVINYQENKSLFLVDMTPKDKSIQEYLDKVKIFVQKSSYQVVAVEISEKGGDYTHINFINRVYNNNLPDEGFIIK
ncbi:LolA family protein [Xanthocytophaga flava]|uniref:LolA family protein n=1 Tax=Xanthocytophaga flava TaxID=3048013 RepID=UPI0028D7E15A|nr:outer membrane lipoprotein carrier protein LolA [Xanthocytophaga flavus]